MRHAGLVLALAFFTIGLAVLHDYGVTMDEAETYDASNDALRFTVPDPSPHELPGFYFPFDLLRGITAHVLADRLGWSSVPTAHHLVHLALSSAAVGLLFGLALRAGGRPMAAILATLALVTMPKFVAHSQANPKDLPALFTFVLAVDAWTRFRRRRGPWPAAGFGAALGVALATREMAAVIVPVVVLWTLLDGPRREIPSARNLLLAGVVGAATFLLCWPWLWNAPVPRLLWAVRHVSTFARGPDVLYLGRIFSSTDLPWHYSLVSIAVSTPLGHVAAVLLGLTVVIRALRDRRDGPEGPSVRSLALLGAVWCAVLFLADGAAHARYDGVRHLLPILPGIALLVGAGLTALHDAVASQGRPILAKAAIAAVIAQGAVAIATIHPYQDAWLNEVTNILLPGPAEEYLEVETWGFPYKEGAAWIDAHAEPNARVFLVWSPQANLHLHKEGISPAQADFTDSSVPGYLMFITRVAFYGPFVEHVIANYREVFTVRRQRAKLLRVFKNERTARPGDRRTTGGS